MKRTMSILMAAALCLAVLAGCGASGGSAASTAAVAPDMAVEESMAADMATGGTDGGARQLLPQDSRKIIYNAELWLESKTYDDTLAALLEAAEQAGGYLQSSEESGSREEGDRSAYYVLRVPSEEYSGFLTAAGEAGNLVRRTESTQDVTAEYVDVEARLASLEDQRQRLQELADQAQTVEELLAIQEQLTQVQYQIESYTGQKRVLDDQIDYSTVEIYLDEVAQLTPVNESFGSRALTALQNGWSGFVTGAQQLIITLIYLMPTLICLALAAAVVVLAVRAWRKKHPRKGKKAPNLPGTEQMK